MRSQFVVDYSLWQSTRASRFPIEASLLLSPDTSAVTGHGQALHQTFEH